MEKFKNYQALISQMSDTKFLIDCAAMPNDHLKQADVDLLLLEITQRIWRGQDSMLCACPIARVLACSC